MDFFYLPLKLGRNGEPASLPPLVSEGTHLFPLRRGGAYPPTNLCRKRSDIICLPASTYAPEFIIVSIIDVFDNKTKFEDIFQSCCVAMKNSYLPTLF